MPTNNALPMLGRRTANAGLCDRPDSAAWVTHERTQVKLAERIDLANAVAMGEHDTSPFDWAPFADDLSRWALEDALNAGVDDPTGLSVNGAMLRSIWRIPVPVDGIDGLEPHELAEMLEGLHDAGVDALDHMRVPDEVPALWGDAFDPGDIQWGFSVSTRPPGGVTGNPVPDALAQANA